MRVLKIKTLEYKIKHQYLHTGTNERVEEQKDLVSQSLGGPVGPARLRAGNDPSSTGQGTHQRMSAGFPGELGAHWMR